MICISVISHAQSTFSPPVKDGICVFARERLPSAVGYVTHKIAKCLLIGRMSLARCLKGVLTR